MDNSQRLNESLEKLNTHVNDLQSTSEIFNKIKDLSHTYKAVIDEIQASGANLKTILKIHQDYRADVLQSVSQIESRIDLQHKTFTSVFESQMKGVESQQIEFRNKFEEKIRALEGLKQKMLKSYLLVIGLSLLNIFCIAYCIAYFFYHQYFTKG